MASTTAQSNLAGSQMPSLTWWRAICSASCVTPSGAAKGKKKKYLVIFKAHSLLRVAEHLPIVYEVLITSRSQQLNKIPENNRRHTTTVLIQKMTWISCSCCPRRVVKLQNRWQRYHTFLLPLFGVFCTRKTLSGSHFEAYAIGQFAKCG